jgi:hypothetical protein
MENYQLTKSTYVKGIQCQKSLYLHTYKPELKSPLSASQEAIFKNGTKVGILAQSLFPNGTLIQYQDCIKKTKEAIKNKTKVIYEAAFLYNQVLVLLDILVLENNQYKAYEVKSSTSITETYLLDSAIQYYVISKHIKLKDISVIHINNQYVKDDNLNINKLFTIQSVLPEVLKLQTNIPNNIQILKDVLSLNQEPEVEIETYCSNPYDCEFISHCWKGIPKYSIFNISRLSDKKKFELYKKNIVEFKDIPSDFKLNDNQWMQVNSELNNETIINKEKIKEFTNNLKYPIKFMDFETFSTAVPIFNNSKPYQQIAFQYSLHSLSRTSKLTHTEFLANSNTDTRIDFIENLIKDCGKRGTILVYNIGFERSRLNELSNVFPKYKNDINKIIKRLVDLMEPFQQKWYYTSEMQGSYSIKKVLPALVKEFTYNNLSIKEGLTASNTFASMIINEFEGDVEQTRNDLLEYCKMDTLAMVKIFEKLLEKI